MKKKLLVLMLAATMSAPAYSECIMRSTSTMKVSGVIEGITDLTPVVTTVSNHETNCSMRARVLYHGNWETIYADYTGETSIGEIELCTNAAELGVRQFLASKEDKKVYADQKMVCSDENSPPQPVKVGEIVQESDVKPDPTASYPFPYKGTTCRRFIETEGTVKDPANLRQYHGTICKTGRVTANTWVVMEKF